MEAVRHTGSKLQWVALFLVPAGLLITFFLFLTIVHWLAVFDLGPIPDDEDYGYIGPPGASVRAHVLLIAVADTSAAVLLIAGALAIRKETGRSLALLAAATALVFFRAAWTIIAPVLSLLLLLFALQAHLRRKRPRDTMT